MQKRSRNKTTKQYQVSTQPVCRRNKKSLRYVIVVGNNWDGTVDIYDPYTHQRIKKLSAMLDKEEKLQELSNNIKR